MGPERRVPDMWPRVQGLRALELGTPGAFRDELTALVLAGRKQATAGLLAEYTEEGEELETVGERLVLLDSDGKSLGSRRGHRSRDRPVR